MAHKQHKCTECGSTWTDADLPGRSVGMQAGDTFLNNTEYELYITDPNEVGIALVEPGHVFEAPVEMTILFDANLEYSFRVYLGSGYRRN
jgi:hypothetical protein